MVISTQTPPADAAVTTDIPFFDLGGSGQPIHFLHANGYPPGCYKPLLDKLATTSQVFGMLLRPLWQNSDPLSIRDWKPFSDDLCRFLLDLRDASVVGMGHSIGAIVTLRAAIQKPELFRAIILIDPVLLPKQRILQLRVLRALGLSRRMNSWASAALRRRRKFDDLEQLYAGYRRRDIFRFFSDENLRMLIQGLTRPTDDGFFELVYSPEWEARIYQTGIWNDLDLWSGLPGLNLPTLIIRGAETDTFWEITGKKVRQTNPTVQVVTIPKATHLVPMEKPNEVAAAIKDFLTLQS